MDRKEPHNPPDHDEPPPSYEESGNTAYNPAFMPQQGSLSPQQPSHTPPFSPPHTADTSQPSPFLAPSAPTLPQLQQPSLEQQQQQVYPNVPQPQPPLSPQHYYYQSINIPPPPTGYSRQPLIYRRSHRYIVDRSFPIAALFFLFGWFCPPLWVLGACCCSGSRNPYESWWGKVNFIMAVMFILSSIIYSMVAITVGDWTVGLRVLRFYTH